MNSQQEFSCQFIPSHLLHPQQQGVTKKRTNNPKACDACKMSHKKCKRSDTNSNCCDKCKMRGIDCEFETPRKKRGRPIGSLNKEKVKILFFFSNIQMLSILVEY